MQISQEERQRQFRIIYENLQEIPRISYLDLSLILETNKKTAGLRFRDAIKKQIIIGPQLRKKSFENLKEYMYFVTCKDPELFYLSYREDPNIIYHAKTMGLYNLWVVAKEKIDIKGDIICEGYRSDYYISYAPDRGWDAAMKIIDKKVKAFDTKNYEPQHFIETHLDETILWNETDQILFEYFKPNLRNPFSKMMKNQEIFSERIYRFLRELPDKCTVFTAYFPEGLSSYDPYLFMIETDYEDFIIDLFSGLPSTSTFFKVNDKLFVYIDVPKEYMRTRDLKIVPNELYIPHFLMNLRKRGIVKSSECVIVEYYWRKLI
jgi:hypothetical protein